MIRFPPELKISENVSLKPLTALGIGGCADYFVGINSEQELRLLCETARKYGLPLTVIGRGSKLLITDKGVRGVTAALPGIDEIIVEGDNVTAGAGASLIKLAGLCINNGLAGLEWAVGIPGSLGGAVYMNAGAYGGEMSDIIDSVEAFDGEKLIMLSAADCVFGYRSSLFAVKKNLIVTCVRLKMRFEEPGLLKALAKKYRDERAAKQPKGKSAGSMFKRCAGFSAGELIEQTGLKGLRIGGAEISQRHANFLLNRGNASYTGAEAVLGRAENEVYNKFGVKLEREIITIGEI